MSFDWDADLELWNSSNVISMEETMNSDNLTLSDPPEETSWNATGYNATIPPTSAPTSAVNVKQTIADVAHDVLDSINVWEDNTTWTSTNDTAKETNKQALQNVIVKVKPFFLFLACTLSPFPCSSRHPIPLSCFLTSANTRIKFR